MFNRFSKKTIDRQQILTNELIKFATTNYSTIGFCHNNQFNYHWRSKLRYKLQWYRGKYKNSLTSENGDLEREFLLKIMLRFLDKQNTRKNF